MLIGHGWDLHQHSENKTLKLGGVNFDEEGFEGHSDGDILLHALCDALLGATGKKDLGHYFPSNESITQKFNVQDKAVKIQNNLSKLLKVPVEKINIKGKSSDDYGIIGDQKASLAIVSLLLDDA
jgi:2C-methyl-D-erythritol 2,4-cyclodiphosphate synthase